MQKLTKKNILRLPEEISHTLQHRNTSSKHLVFYKTSNPLDVARIGLAIPKKHAKRAVDRNRIKRIIRESFRKNTSFSSQDLVVKLQIPIGKKTKKRLRESERQHIRQQVKEFFGEN
jgi:ribonuclease P protein component